MHVILFYDIGEDYVERRGAYRNEHLALARQAFERGELVLGGALADPVDGVVLVFRGPTTEGAEAFAKADPYVKNGVVKGWRARKWTTVVGEGSTAP